MLIGICGKTNVGKSTFFAAATLANVEIGDRPFVTIRANEGVGFVRVKSVCTEFNLKCNPSKGFCNGIFRLVPVKLLDVAGLVRDAHRGRGLGNRFLDDLRRSDVNIVVIDASGGTDAEGRPVPPGSHDPIEDVKLVIEEFKYWLFGLLKKNWVKVSRMVNYSKQRLDKALYEVLSGVGIDLHDLNSVLLELGFKLTSVGHVDEDKLLALSSRLIDVGKPFVIAANKMDVPEARDNIKRIVEEFKDYKVVPVSAEAELVLRKASSMGLISYFPGDSSFKILDESRLSSAQSKALDKVKDYLSEFGSTGIQSSLEIAVFDVLGYKAVFPVENENRLTDKSGNVLPDVYLLPPRSTLKDLAFNVHSELAASALYGIDVRSKRRISLDTVLEHRSIVKIVSTSRK